MHSGARSNVLYQALLTLGILLFAFAAAGSGLDRISETLPGAERMVPGPFRARSERVAAIAAFARGDDARALQFARAAVASDPVDPDASAILATAHLQDGEARKADEAMRVAARFGWRNLATQAYWYHVALQGGEFAVAVDRADAILRIAPALPGRTELLAPLEQDPAARRILVRHLAERPGWLESYLSGPAESDNALLQRRAAVGEELAQTPSWSGCKECGGLARKRLMRGDRLSAERLWNKACPQMAVAPGLVDGNFRALAGDVRNPFGWVAERSGNVVFRLERQDKNGTGARAVAMRNDGAATALVLHQAVNLKPGDYLLRADVAGSSSSPVQSLVASMGCGANAPFPAEVKGDLAGAGQIVHSPGCAAQTLALWLRPGKDEIRLRQVSLTPAQ